MKKNSDLQRELDAALARVPVMAVCDVVVGHPDVTIGELAQNPGVAGIKLFDVLKLLQERMGSSAPVTSAPLATLRTEPAREPDPEPKAQASSAVVRQKISEVLASKKTGLKIREISEEIDFPIGKLSYYLRPMIEEGLVSKTGIPSQTRYSLAPKKRVRGGRTERHSDPASDTPAQVSSSLDDATGSSGPPKTETAATDFSHDQDLPDRSMEPATAMVWPPPVLEPDVDLELEATRLELEKLEREERELEYEKLVAASKQERKPSRRKTEIEAKYPYLAGADIQKGLRPNILKKASELAAKILNGEELPLGAQFKLINASGGRVYSARVNDGHRLILRKEDDGFRVVRLMTRENFDARDWA
jgi:hypothetical protein